MESLNCFAHDKDVTSDVLDKMSWLMAREAKRKGIDVTIYNSSWYMGGDIEYLSQFTITGLGCYITYPALFLAQHKPHKHAYQTKLSVYKVWKVSERKE